MKKGSLLIFRGLPGSGKTTEARRWVAYGPSFRARVNRDDIRAMLHNGEYLGHATEQQVVAVRDAAIGALLGLGIEVCSDDTNLPQDTVRGLAKLAWQKGLPVEESHLVTPLDECIRRDAARAKPVGEAVIRGMYAKFLHRPLEPISKPSDTPETVEPYVPLPMLPGAVLVDIDGTVALHNGRDPYDESRVSEDLPNAPVWETVVALKKAGNTIVFLSGRSDACQVDTFTWLAKHMALAEGREVAGHFLLYMRKSGDKRKDAIVKRELFDEHIRHNWNVRLVLDDRQSVVDMWRALGLTCLQVAPGDF